MNLVTMEDEKSRVLWFKSFTFLSFLFNKCKGYLSLCANVCVCVGGCVRVCVYVCVNDGAFVCVHDACL